MLVGSLRPHVNSGYPKICRLHRRAKDSQRCRQGGTAAILQGFPIRNRSARRRMLTMGTGTTNSKSHTLTLIIPIRIRSKRRVFSRRRTKNLYRTIITTRSK